MQKTFSVRHWVKSACAYCPFALATKAGKASTVAQFIAEPGAGVLALVMEYSATALNATQGLIKGERLLTLLRSSPGTGAVLGKFARCLTMMPWAVYDVRRTLSPRSDGKANHARSVRILDVGPRDQMRVRLQDRAALAGVPMTIGDPAFPDDTHPRVWLRRREPLLPTSTTATAEQFFVIAPATAVTKTGPAFPLAWAEANQLHFTL